MTARFEIWFTWLLKWEGTTFENDPDDRGGATKYGIDQRSHPNVNIRTLTRKQAAQIYWDEYWTRVRAEDLPAGVGEIVADIAVNNGIDRAGRWLQQAVGENIDGKIGPMTVAAARRAKPGTQAVKVLAGWLLDRREMFYKSIANGSQAKFLKGWLNRNNDARKVWNS